MDSFEFPETLGSDNHADVHPKIMESILAANYGFAPSYGTDPLTLKAQKLIQKTFESEVEVSFCFNGTAANILSLAPLLKSFESVITTDCAHLNVDECGAPEKNLGIKLISIPNSSLRQGKLTAEEVNDLIIRRGDQHFSQVRAVSITQPTELGTVYSIAEIDAIKNICEKHGLFLHIDGARLCNAAYTLGVSLSEFAKRADVISLGGTKNGFLFGEAVLYCSERAQKLANHQQAHRFHRKQLMQLPSKTRFIAAQFVQYFQNNLWHEIAKKSCESALALGRALKQSSAQIEPEYPIQSNAVFVKLSRAQYKALIATAFFYVWNEKSLVCRLMTSHSTSEQLLSRFASQITAE